MFQSRKWRTVTSWEILIRGSREWRSEWPLVVGKRRRMTAGDYISKWGMLASVGWIVISSYRPVQWVLSLERYHGETPRGTIRRSWREAGLGGMKNNIQISDFCLDFKFLPAMFAKHNSAKIWWWSSQSSLSPLIHSNSAKTNTIIY